MASADVDATPSRAFDGVTVGDELEVLWKITRTVEGQEDIIEEKWWPAKIQEKLHTTAEQGRELWQLLYEQFEEFDAETRDVAFLSEHELIDTDTGEQMLWRKKGDDWDQMGGDENLSDPDRVYTAHELASIIDEQVRSASGGASEEEMMRTLQTAVPPQQLLQGASAMRDFIDKFKEHMQKTAAAQSGSDGPLVVTKDMVDEFTRSLKAN